MPGPQTLTGQDIGEAEGAAIALLERTLATTGTGISRYEWIVMRVLIYRPPFDSPAALADFLAGQRQLGLDPPGVAALLEGMEAKGLISGSAPGGTGPARMTEAGAALHTRLSEDVAKATASLFADVDPEDLATAKSVLNRITERANRLRADQ